MGARFVSVIIPAYNEAKRIAPTLKKVSSFLEGLNKPYEILVVDDGSRDKTVETIEKLNLPFLRILSYGTNRGKGYAINFGMRSASGQWILFSDADNSTPISELPKLLEAAGSHEVVIGSRYLPESNVKVRQPLVRVMLSRIGNLLTQLIILPGVRDTQCGFKLFSHQAAQTIFPRQTIWGWGFDIEILRIAREAGYKIKEVPVIWINDEGSRLQSSRAFIGTFLELLRIKKNSLLGRYKRASVRSEPVLLFRFIIVGALGTALDFLVLNLAHAVFGVPLRPALALGFTAGAINNYLINSFWSFGQKTSWKKFLTFFLIAFGGLLLNNLIVSTLVTNLNWHYNLAKLLAVGVIFCWNYLLNRKLTFN